MEIAIKEPATGEWINLNAQREEYHDESRWRIFYPEKDSFLMARENGDWQIVDEADINPELIEAVAEAL